MTIIDDLLTGINKEFSKIQNKTEDALKGYNLSNQIKDIERKKTAKLIEIGKLVCDKYSRNSNVTEDELKDKANEIAGYDHEISLLQSELDTMKTQNDPNTSASQRAEAKAGYTPTPGYECPRCHAPANKEKAFCPLCGENLKCSDDDIVDVEPNGGADSSDSEKKDKS